MRTEKYHTLEDDLAILKDRTRHNSFISIIEILEILSGKGRSLVIVFLSLPFCQPIQIPGFSTPFGILIAFFGLRMIFGKHIWLPKKILYKKVSSKTVEKIADKTIGLVNKMKRFTHPRFVWICLHPFMQIVNGLLIILLGILLAMPLPVPFSNLVAAWAIFLIGLGILEDDGVFVLCGYIISSFALAFFVSILLSTKYLLGI